MKPTDHSSGNLPHSDIQASLNEADLQAKHNTTRRPCFVTQSYMHDEEKPGVVGCSDSVWINRTNHLLAG